MNLVNSLSYTSLGGVLILRFLKAARVVPLARLNSTLNLLKDFSMGENLPIPSIFKKVISKNLVMRLVFTNVKSTLRELKRPASKPIEFMRSQMLLKSL